VSITRGFRCVGRPELITKPTSPLNNCNFRKSPRVFVWWSSWLQVSWDVTPCSLVDMHQHFGGTGCLHLQKNNHHTN
jgi:hypothetical protein